MKIYVVAAAVGLVTLAAGAAGLSRIFPEKSQIAFVSRQMGVPVEGSFNKFTVSLAFDPTHPEQAKAHVEIDLKSVDAGSQEAYEELMGKDWFSVKQFPSAQFTSTAVKPLGGGKYEVQGQLSLKGKTRAVSAPFTIKAQGSDTLIEGALPIRRLDYGIGEGTWGDTSTVADEVQVKFRFLARAM